MQNLQFGEKILKKKIILLIFNKILFILLNDSQIYIYIYIYIERERDTHTHSHGLIER